MQSFHSTHLTKLPVHLSEKQGLTLGLKLKFDPGEANMFLEVITCLYPQGSAGFIRDYLIKLCRRKKE